MEILKNVIMLIIAFYFLYVYNYIINFQTYNAAFRRNRKEFI